MSSTAVATTENLSPAELEKAAAELSAEVQGSISADEIALPLIKLCQPLSKEVQASKAKPGDFVNSVTGRNYGNEFWLVIAGKFQGRFHTDKDSDRTYVAQGAVAPSNWPEQYAGRRFDEIEDAEEIWKDRANDPNDSFEFGSGPPISTTHNFVGFIADETNVPVRISLMRSSAGSARTISTLLKISRQIWDSYVTLTAEEGVDGKGRKFHRWGVSEGEATTDEDKQAAIRLAIDLKKVNVVLAGDDAVAADAKAKPAKAEGALSVD